MPTCLLTWAPTATRPGLLAQAGPEPSSRGVQGPAVGSALWELIPLSQFHDGTGKPPGQDGSHRLRATTGRTGVPAPLALGLGALLHHLALPLLATSGPGVFRELQGRGATTNPSTLAGCLPAEL